MGISCMYYLRFCQNGLLILKVMIRPSTPKGPAKLFKIAAGDFVGESYKRPPRMAEVSILHRYMDVTY